MNLKINSWLYSLQQTFDSWNWNSIVLIISIILSTAAILWSFNMHAIVAYGDAEAHLNIAKRVIDGLTPGFAQLGGVWLPLPHLMMLPFIWSDFMWRTGLAGTIPSAFMYIVGCFTLFKLMQLLTKSTFVSFITFLIFALNPNILYLQSTPMTELPLFSLLILATYFFIKYLKNNNDYIALIFAALFTFGASLARYDAWFLIPIEGLIIFLQYAFRKATWEKAEARLVLFGVLAVFGIFIWLGWDGLILGNPLYFTNSPYSAKSQQAAWASSGELLSYRNLPLSTYQYTMTVIENSGIIFFVIAVIGLIVLLLQKKDKNKFFYLLLLSTPFIFNVFALWAGESVLYVPSTTPVNFEWHIFNARYGAVMIPAIAIFIGYLLYKLNTIGKIIVISALMVGMASFYTGRTPVITYNDGIMGQSSRISNASSIYWDWVYQNYDGGLVLMDDYRRPISLIESGIPMQNTVYVGSKPYYENALRDPRKVRWFILGPNDDIWKDPNFTDRSQEILATDFTKVLVTPNFTIYKRNDTVATTQ